MSQYFNTPSPQGPGRGAPGPAVRGPRTSGLAITSLVLGLVGLALFFVCLGLILGPLSIFFGVISMVLIGKAPDRLKGKGLAIAGMVAASLAIAANLGFISWAKNQAESDLASGTSSSGPPSAVKVAESNILSKSDGKIAHGNSPEAEALAIQLSERMKMMRQLFFSEGKSSSLSLSGGDFLTHCEMHEDTCAFLVHVPDLRKFNTDAKESLNDLAWMAAQGILTDTDFPDGGKLAVGLKGVILYDDIRLGRHVKESDEDEENVGLERRKLSIDDLAEFFPEPSAAPDATETSAPATPASPAGTPAESPETGAPSPATENPTTTPATQ